MKIFLSAIENSNVAKSLVEQGFPMKWNLMSYYYIRNCMPKAVFIRDHSQEVMIDSGAHSFQFGAKVDFEAYTKAYAGFIRAFDRPNIVGFFEMDCDNVIGYPRVLELRRILEQVSDKIIPVWHKERGIGEFWKMCRDCAGRVVSVTGFKNADIKDEQYLSFLKYAKHFGCKVHCLGMTRPKVLDRVPFDYVDSSSWKHYSIFGTVYGRGKVPRAVTTNNRLGVDVENYKLASKMQDFYYSKWRQECND